MTEVTKKRGPGRPRKEETRATERPTKRIPIHEQSGTLSVMNKDPDYEYYWELDSDERGTRIARLQLAGWDFAPADAHKIGETMVYKSENVGSIIRVPAGRDGRYLYLMRIRKEWYDEDKKVQSDRIKEQERQMNTATPGADYIKKSGIGGGDPNNY